VDLIVSFAPGQTPGFRFFDLLEELESLLGVRVDVLTETGLATIENPILRAAILANKQLVYAEPGAT
jgi:predicted nucleotidyltransferase